MGMRSAAQDERRASGGGVQSHQSDERSPLTRRAELCPIWRRRFIERFHSFRDRLTRLGSRRRDRGARITARARGLRGGGLFRGETGGSRTTLGRLPLLTAGVSRRVAVRNRRTRPDDVSARATAERRSANRGDNQVEGYSEPHANSGTSGQFTPMNVPGRRSKTTHQSSPVCPVTCASRRTLRPSIPLRRIPELTPTNIWEDGSCKPKSLGHFA